VFDLQDQVASSVAGVIEPALQTAGTDRGAYRPTNNLTAYDLYLRLHHVTRFGRSVRPGTAAGIERASP
jgi:adenylate cyclase